MKIALFGYGKMGKEIEQVALERGHEITLKITSDNLDDRQKVGEVADAVIEFSRPETAEENIRLAIDQNVPIVVGTTGWLDKLDELSKLVQVSDTGLLWASNFSVGVNIFFEVNRQLAKLMNSQSNYDCELDETHHIHKLDAPSGTAITIAEGIIDELDRKSSWKLDNTTEGAELLVKAHRINEVPGTHEVTYKSDIDQITIKHEAKSRKGFALGAVLAAEWLAGKSGVFTMKDVLSN